MINKIKYYNTLNYQINLEHNIEDNTWTAYHPEFGRGSCYATSNDKFEAIHLLAQDREELIKYLLAENMDIPEPFTEEDLPTGKIPLRIPRSLHLRIKKYAVSEGISVNQFISTQLAFCWGQYSALQNVSNEISNLIQNVYIQRVSQIMEFSDYNNIALPKRKRSSSINYWSTRV